MGRTQSDNIKHAYLIMAHCDFGHLRNLIHELDDERNDIFLHVDLRSRDFDPVILDGCVTKAGLYMMPREKIYWGHISVVECEISMLKCAVQKGSYRYYHLISGQDYPIAGQDYIHEVFDDSDLEYITAWPNNKSVSDARNYTEAYKYYYLLNGFKYRFGEKSLKKKFFMKLDCLLINAQKKMGVDRENNDAITLIKGDQWFSVTENMARKIIETYPKIKYRLKNIMTPDEFLVASIANCSEFKPRIADTNYRLIDWNRGTPYFYKESDFDEIVASGKLFVRKVSTVDSGELAQKLSEYIRKQTNEI